MSPKKQTTQKTMATVSSEGPVDLDQPIKPFDFSAMTKDQLGQFAATIGKKIDLRKPIETLIAECEALAMGASEKEHVKAGSTSYANEVPPHITHVKNNKTGLVFPISLPLYNRINKFGGFTFCDEHGKPTAI